MCVMCDGCDLWSSLIDELYNIVVERARALGLARPTPLGSRRPSLSPRPRARATPRAALVRWVMTGERARMTGVLLGVNRVPYPG